MFGKKIILKSIKKCHLFTCFNVLIDEDKHRSEHEHHGGNCRHDAQLLLLWFLQKATIIGKAKASTRADAFCLIPAIEVKFLDIILLIKFYDHFTIDVTVSKEKLETK